jgi:hypothetical protein
MRRLLPVNGWAGIDPSRAKRRSVLRFNLMNAAASAASMYGSAISSETPFGLLETTCLSKLYAGRGTEIVSGLDETSTTAFMCCLHSVAMISVVTESRNSVKKSTVRWKFDRNLKWA